MPWDKSKYPKNWRLISAKVRKRAAGRCECTGECGLHGGQAGLNLRCREHQGKKALWAKGKVRLTVHHLDFNTKNNKFTNLKAMCQRCHLRCDCWLHLFHRRESRNKNQLKLFAYQFRDPQRTPQTRGPSKRSYWVWRARQAKKRSGRTSQANEKSKTEAR